MKGIYKFYWDYGRQGEVKGTFIATKEEVANIIGKEVYFGEILGKHSEIYNTVDEEDIELITDDQAIIEVTEKIGILPTGYNPVDYYSED
jgi:hypothetical protein